MRETVKNGMRMFYSMERQEWLPQYTEENDLMRLSAELDEGQKRTAAQTKLVDSVTESLRPQMNQLGAWVQNLPEDEQEFRASLKKAAVLLSYAKRRGNLLFCLVRSPRRA